MTGKIEPHSRVFPFGRNASSFASGNRHCTAVIPTARFGHSASALSQERSALFGIFRDGATWLNTKVASFVVTAGMDALVLGGGCGCMAFRRGGVLRWSVSLWLERVGPLLGAGVSASAARGSRSTVQAKWTWTLTKLPNQK